MGTLSELVRFLEKSGKAVDSIIEKLNEVQSVYNRNFNNVRTVRTSEIDFLQDEFFKNPARFPEAIPALYSRCRENEEKKFNKSFEELTRQKQELDRKRDEIGRQQREALEKLKKSNRILDSKEEKLKRDIAELEVRIDGYNDTIRELNTLFGFLINLGKMRKLEKEKKELLAARDDYIEKIESIRTRWVDAEKESETHNKDLQEKWNNIETDYALTAEKLDTLSENRKELIDKAAFTAMLQQLTGNEDFLRAAVPGVEPASLCGKCGLPNNGNLFFCSYCGEPFMENRPDIAGSLVETGELNGIYEALNSGIGETVSMIALFNGLNKGIDTFSGSVKKVKASEDKYSQLSKLRIDVPDFSLTFARNLQGVEKSIDPLGGSLHPAEFAEQLKKIISDLMTEENIERFFTDMGEELDRRTKEQWK